MGETLFFFLQIICKLKFSDFFLIGYRISPTSPRNDKDKVQISLDDKTHNNEGIRQRSEVEMIKPGADTRFTKSHFNPSKIPQQSSDVTISKSSKRKKEPSSLSPAYFPLEP